MMSYMGIDGGSNLRVAVVDDDLNILTQALASIACNVAERAGTELNIRFCGRLLTAQNALSAAPCRALGLPQPIYPPVVGAGLLAKLRLEGKA
jgi:hypothetical protein